MDSNDRTNVRSQAVSLPLPKSFDGTAASWKLWSQRFDRYYYATQLHQKDRQEQVSVYLYAMGEPEDDLLMVLQIDDSKITYQELKGKLDQHFGDRKNVIVERAKFNQRKQKPGEPIDNAIQDLHKLAVGCELGNLKEELIRDRIVVGVLSDSLSEELQAKPKLTFSLVIQISRQAEARSESQPLLRDTPTVHALKQREQVKQKFPNFKDPAVPSYTAKHPSQTCTYCGRESHSSYQCPARNATCALCQKRGHYKIVCRSGRNKSIHELFNDTDSMSDHFAECNFHMENKEDSEFFLGSLEQEYDEMRTATLKVNGHPTTFKLDTGAAVSVISSNEPWLKGITLQKADKILRGPGGSTISPLGAFKASISYQGRNIIKTVYVLNNQSSISYQGRNVIETVYVLNNQSCSLLSKKACYELDMIRRVNSIKTTATKSIDSTSADNSSLESSVRRDFPDLFSGLGQVKTEYTIKLKENAQPTCIYTPRKIAHPLLPKVQAELENMIKLGIISQISEPTDWCSGIVVAPKPNQGVRICVDLTQLNKSVQREIYPMSSVDESLAKLGQSKIFTKLDCESGFWQIPLFPKSRRLTTFITPFGRFCFNRLPFGISSASEIFQRMMTEVLIDMEGVICHMYDILVHAKDQPTHDKIVREVLQRLSDAGLTLNCKISRTHHRREWNSSRSKKSGSHQKISSPFQRHRIAKIHGNGESTGKIHPTPC